MASRIPEKLKSADIARFATRAAQVEPHKPAVAYWAYYYIVQQILGKGLHTADDECKQYTTRLLDKLEQMKTQYSMDDAITDDLAGQAYVEQFGLEIFQRADNAVIANKTTRTTGDNFWTAATFLDLLHTWGDLSPDVSRKTKYAKMEAARIFKAIKAGEDPNLSNPAAPQESDAPAPALDPNDPEVQKLNSAAAAEPPSTDVSEEQNTASEQPKPPLWGKARHQPLWPPRRPTVVEIPDEHDRLQQDLARQSSRDESLHPSRAPSVPRPAPAEQPTGNVPSGSSPKPPPAETNQPVLAQTDTNPRKDSVSGGYFAEASVPQAPRNPATDAGVVQAVSAGPQAMSPAPQAMSPAPQTMSPAPQAMSPAPQTMSTAPQTMSPAPQTMSLAPQTMSPASQTMSPAPQTMSPAPQGWAQPQGALSPDANIQSFYGMSPAQSAPVQPPAPPITQPPYAPPVAQQPVAQSPQAGWPVAQPPPQAAPQQSPQVTYPAQPPAMAQPVPANVPSQFAPQSHVADDAAMTAAQKHAKFAISALNFEDVPTAVKELREALRSLGAS